MFSSKKMASPILGIVGLEADPSEEELAIHRQAMRGRRKSSSTRVT